MLLITPRLPAVHHACRYHAALKRVSCCLLTYSPLHVRGYHSQQGTASMSEVSDRPSYSYLQSILPNNVTPVLQQ